MSDDGDRTDETGEPSPDETQAGGFGGDNAGPPPHEPTAAYGATAAPQPQEAPAAGPDASSAYGSVPGAASPQWATPGQDAPQHTAVQPVPGQQPQEQAPAAAPPYYPQQQYTPQPQNPPATQAYQQAQPAPAQPWQHATPSGYGAPQPQPAPGANAPGGSRRWNLWAGIAAATSISALGGVWRLAKVISDVGNYPFRAQLTVALMAALLALGLLTLLALAAKKRGPAVVLTLLLGATVLADVFYGWYIQMDSRIGGFESDYLFDFLGPASLPALMLGTATLVAAFLMRVDDVR